MPAAGEAGNCVAGATAEGEAIHAAASKQIKQKRVEPSGQRRVIDLAVVENGMGITSSGRGIEGYGVL